MTKEDWVDVLSTLVEKSAIDYVTLAVSIASPLLLLVSVIISFRAAKASRDSVSLNKEIYERQEEERRLLHMPIFEPGSFSKSSNRIIFDLLNINEKQVSFTNFGSEYSLEKFKMVKMESHKLRCVINGDFENVDKVTLWINYTTLDHRKYVSKLILRIIDGSLVIQDHDIK